MPNLLKEELALPRLVLKKKAVERNRAWMKRYLRLTGFRLAPHGKTPFSPEIARMQLADDAWALTAATTDQVRVFRRAGASRILFANQLAGEMNIRFIVGEVNRRPRFEFFCLLDSPEGVRYLSARLKECGLQRPLQALVEAGVPGGRCGCRTLADALATASAIAQVPRVLRLRGVEGYEGAIPAGGIRGTMRFYGFMRRVARALENRGLFAPGPVVVSAGVTATLDLVYGAFKDFSMGRPHVMVLRSGCYLFSDHGAYGRIFDAMLRRSPFMRSLGPGPEPALELWSTVLSRPEPGLAVCGFGRRDCPFDKGLPVPLKALRPGARRAPRPLSGCAFTALNDHHAILKGPGVKSLAVGDLVGAGISHPCGAFERWRKAVWVDDKYNVLGDCRTCF